MKQSSLDLLCCPFCYSALSLNNKNENGGNEELLCSTCDRHYPLRNGIVHFIDPRVLEGPNQKFARYYDRFAPIYTIFSKLAFLPFGGERKARMEILEQLDPSGKRILEVSIGNGVNLPYIYDLLKPSDVFGIDISIGMLSQCTKIINNQRWQVDLFLATAEALPFRHETFDNVLHIGGINFFSDKNKSIEEMIRVTRPGGKIVIADEAERFAKQAKRTVGSPPKNHGNEAVDATIQSLVPDTMHDIRMEGIWKMHGRHHGYCLAFTKPLK